MHCDMAFIFGCAEGLELGDDPKAGFDWTTAPHGIYVPIQQDRAEGEDVPVGSVPEPGPAPLGWRCRVMMALRRWSQ